MTTAIRLRDVGPTVSRREEFTAGPLRGVRVRWPVNPERMPADLAAKLETAVRDNRNRDRSTYVVTSYGTPIAWTAGEDALVVPPVRYSTTTSKHQYQLRGVR